jgi:hypothetical protein
VVRARSPFHPLALPGRELLRSSARAGEASELARSNILVDDVLRVLRLALRVQDREGYWWVECSGCDAGWQVPHYAESVG